MIQCVLSTLVVIKDVPRIFYTRLDMPVNPFIGIEIEFPKFTVTITYVKWIAGDRNITATCEIQKQLSSDLEKLLLNSGWTLEPL